MSDEQGQNDDRFAEALWLALMCRCERCGLILESDFLEKLLVEDSTKWSLAAAQFAHGKGWRCADEMTVFCPECRGRVV